MDDLKGKVSIYKPNDFNHYVIKLHLESFEYGMSKNFTNKEDLNLLLGFNDILYKKLAKEYNGKFNSKYGICFYDPEDGENFLNNYLLINYKKLLKENVIDNCTEEVENLLEKFDQKKFDEENGFVNDDFESDFEDGSCFIEDMPF